MTLFFKYEAMRYIKSLAAILGLLCIMTFAFAEESSIKTSSSS